MTGVACIQPETVRKALVSVASSFLVWELWHQTWAQYLAVENTSAWVEMRKVLVEAPQVSKAAYPSAQLGHFGVALKASVLDVLRQEVHLVYCRLPMSKAGLLLG